jgi:hypothetical protein
LPSASKAGRWLSGQSRAVLGVIVGIFVEVKTDPVFVRQIESQALHLRLFFLRANP